MEKGRKAKVKMAKWRKGKNAKRRKGETGKGENGNKGKRENRKRGKVKKWRTEIGKRDKEKERRGEKTGGMGNG